MNRRLKDARRTRRRPVQCAQCENGTVLYVRRAGAAVCPSCAGIPLETRGPRAGLPLSSPDETLFVRYRARAVRL